MERKYAPEKKTVGIPSMSDFKKLLPLASNIELKDKFLEFIQQQLNVDFSDCFQANSFKSGSLMEEDAETDNEDMEAYLDNLTTLASPLNTEEEKVKKDKGKNKI